MLWGLITGLGFQALQNGPFPVMVIHHLIKVYLISLFTPDSCGAWAFSDHIYLESFCHTVLANEPSHTVVIAKLLISVERTQVPYSR